MMEAIEKVLIDLHGRGETLMGLLVRSIARRLRRESRAGRAETLFPWRESSARLRNLARMVTRGARSRMFLSRTGHT